MRSELELSYAHCEKIARQSGSSFFVAFRTLPRPMYREMCVLYAFMRRTDDLGDDQQVPAEMRTALLADWKRDLSSALQKRPVTCQILPAMADVAARRHIPAEDLYETILGVQSDLASQTFQTFAELEHYCYQVAGVVGLCCVRIWGHRGEFPREPATACGTAFQLTNILRDLGEDAANGRVYLPETELQQFGYSAAELKAHQRNDAFRSLMQFQVERAWRYYDAALPLRQELSPEGRRIFVGLFDLYSSLLRQIEIADYDVFSRRIRLPLWKKASVAFRCLLRIEGPKKFARVPVGQLE